MPSFTEDEKLLINSGLSMVGGVLVGTVQGTYQYLTQGGNVTFGSAVSFALAGFAALLGVALRAYVPAHAQQMLADAEARATELENALHIATTAQPAILPSIQQTPVAAPVSPVVIHISSGGTVTSVAPDQTAMPPQGGSVIAQPAIASINPPTANTVGTSTILPGTAAPVQSVQLTMTPPVPTIASTPDLASEDTAVRKSVSIVN